MEPQQPNTAPKSREELEESMREKAKADRAFSIQSFQNLLDQFNANKLQFQQARK